MARPTVLITGATGAIGRGLVQRTLRGTAADVIVLLHRHGRNWPVTQLLHFFGCPEEFAPRLKTIAGDLTAPDLGLSFGVHHELTATVTHILHAAAVTRFDLPWEAASQVNIVGTRQIANLALACDHLGQFGVLSTAYVSGKRTGVITERELEHTAGFVNTYEQSKYEAEQLLRGLMPQLPCAVYRLSTVLGNSQTGEVRHFTAPHQALRIMYLGLAAMVPGTPDYVVDLIPSDFAEATVWELFWERFVPGQTFHLCAGAEKSYRLAELIAASFDELGRLDPAWRQRGYPQPAIAPEEAFNLFLQSAEQAGNPLVAGVLGALRHFAHQLSYPKTFDRTTLERVLPAAVEGLPHIRHYFGKVVHYCLTTQWGKHARS